MKMNYLLLCQILLNQPMTSEFWKENVPRSLKVFPGRYFMFHNSLLKLLVYAAKTMSIGQNCQINFTDFMAGLSHVFNILLNTCASLSAFCCHSFKWLFM